MLSTRILSIGCTFLKFLLLLLSFSFLSSNLTSFGEANDYSKGLSSNPDAPPILGVYFGGYTKFDLLLGSLNGSSPKID
jgi:hypothetical protein